VDAALAALAEAEQLRDALGTLPASELNRLAARARALLDTTAT
jgi:hypothetical protein